MHSRCFCPVFKLCNLCFKWYRLLIIWWNRGETMWHSQRLVVDTRANVRMYVNRVKKFIKLFPVLLNIDWAITDLITGYYKNFHWLIDWLIQASLQKLQVIDEHCVGKRVSIAAVFACESCRYLWTQLKVSLPLPASPSLHHHRWRHIRFRLSIVCALHFRRVKVTLALGLVYTLQNDVDIKYLETLLFSMNFITLAPIVKFIGTKKFNFTPSAFAISFGVSYSSTSHVN